MKQAKGETMENEVKHKIMSLLAKAGDPAASESEAESAMRMARKLMDKHGVSEDDLQSVTSDDFAERFEHARMTKHGPAFHPVDSRCMHDIAEFCGVVCLWRTDENGKPVRMRLFGLAADVEYALWFRGAMIRQFNRDWANYRDFGRSNRHRSRLADARRSFALGFANALRERLAKYKRGAAKGTGTDLVVKKYDVAIAELDKRGIGIGGSFGRAVGGTDTAAAGAGYNSGKAATVGTGVKYGSNVKQLN